MSEVFGKLLLERKSQFLNRLKGYKVFINGAAQGMIANGKTEEYEVPAGENTVLCKVNWCSSNEFVIRVDPGKKVFLKVSSGMKYFWPMYILVMLALIVHFFMKGNTELKQIINIVSICIYIPAAIYYLYFVTFGRKAYLKIEEDKDNIFAN